MTFYAWRRRTWKRFDSGRYWQRRFLRRVHEVALDHKAQMTPEQWAEMHPYMLEGRRRARRELRCDVRGAVRVRWSVILWALCFSVGMAVLTRVVPHPYEWAVPILSGVGTWAGVTFMGGTLHKRK